MAADSATVDFFEQAFPGQIIVCAIAAAPIGRYIT
jgi:hypothetical protein